jgi:hypothetical protein
VVVEVAEHKVEVKVAAVWYLSGILLLFILQQHPVVMYYIQLAAEVEFINLVPREQ